MVPTMTIAPAIDIPALTSSESFEKQPEVTKPRATIKPPKLSSAFDLIIAIGVPMDAAIMDIMIIDMPITIAP